MRFLIDPQFLTGNHGAPVSIEALIFAYSEDFNLENSNKKPTYIIINETGVWSELNSLNPQTVLGEYRRGFNKSEVIVIPSQASRYFLGVTLSQKASILYEGSNFKKGNLIDLANIGVTVNYHGFRLNASTRSVL